jgi:hypothetical protein
MRLKHHIARSFTHGKYSFTGSIMASMSHGQTWSGVVRNTIARPCDENVGMLAHEPPAPSRSWLGLSVW